MSPHRSRSIACAHPNIALVKYWGKRDTSLNLPAVGSLSITLDTMRTRTVIEADDELSSDRFVLNDTLLTDDRCDRVVSICNKFREQSGHPCRFRINSDNNFPTAAGLASSASGFAALVLALDDICQTKMDKSELGVYARLGSGSAPRSLFGGFALMAKGNREDGLDAIATELLPADRWPLEVVVAITSEDKKPVSSTSGMEQTRLTSPYYSTWIENQEVDLDEASKAIDARDFERLADVSESSCLKMHALMLSARPGLMYFNPATLSCMHAIRELRKAGTPVFFTVDAGPQVKAVCAPGVATEVQKVLAAISGVERTLATGLGGGAWLETSV